MLINCPNCKAAFVAATTEQADAVFMEHCYTMHNAPRPIVEPEIEITQGEKTDMSEIEKQECPPPPAVMIDGIVIQLEGALEVMKVPSQVESTARAFIAALQEWSKGGQ
jgi:hypothetical protein